MCLQALDVDYPQTLVLVVRIPDHRVFTAFFSLLLFLRLRLPEKDSNEAPVWRPRGLGDVPLFLEDPQRLATVDRDDVEAFLAAFCSIREKSNP
jgi:hypothetical protein